VQRYGLEGFRVLIAPNDCMYKGNIWMDISSSFGTYLYIYIYLFYFLFLRKSTINLHMGWGDPWHHSQNEIHHDEIALMVSSTFVANMQKGLGTTHARSFHRFEPLPYIEFGGSESGEHLWGCVHGWGPSMVNSPWWGWMDPSCTKASQIHTTW
jgi:hypothetical protein